MSEKKFDPTKPVQTRDGRKARILATDVKSTYSSIVAAVTQSDGCESIYLFKSDGSCRSNTANLDLVNIPERVKRELWLNIYGDAYGPAVAHSNRKQADLDAGPTRIACIPVTIEYEEGEGL